jgi:hypothetical protein
MGVGHNFIFSLHVENLLEHIESECVVWHNEGPHILPVEANVTSHSYLDMLKHRPTMPNDTWLLQDGRWPNFGYTLILFLDIHFLNNYTG